MTEIKVLVTGGAGFIGSNFVYSARGRGMRVINLDVLTYAGHLESLARLEGDALHEFVQGDIADSELVRKLLEKHRPMWVVNFAAESHVDRSIVGPSDFVRTNIVGTHTLLEEVRQYWQRLGQEEQRKFRFLQISTDEVYGSLGPGGRFDERAPFAPSSPYSASKAAADHLVGAYHKTYGLPTVTAHPSNNYGPYQLPEKLIPKSIVSALEGRQIPVFGDGLHMREWLYVEDCCEGLFRVLESGTVGERYNLGGNADQTNIQVVDAICSLLDSRAPLATGDRRGLKQFVEDRLGHDRRYAVDSSKAAEALGWKPRVGFDNGLVRTVDWYLANLAWVKKVSS